LASQQAQLEAEKAAFQRQIESEVSQALAQQRDEMQAALAIERQQIHDRKSQARRRQEADLARNRALAEAVTLQTVVEPQTTLQALLKKVEGQTIGINYPDGGSTRKAILLHVGEDYFSVYNGIDGLNYSYPLKTIASVVQSMDGIHTQDESDATEVFLLLQLSIQLSPL
jgi:multidrug efflux pump subunit AcrA (membrane-fusion protein)